MRTAKVKSKKKLYVVCDLGSSSQQSSLGLITMLSYYIRRSITPVLSSHHFQTLLRSSSIDCLLVILTMAMLVDIARHPGLHIRFSNLLNVRLFRPEMASGLLCFTICTELTLFLDTPASMPSYPPVLPRTSQECED